MKLSKPLFFTFNTFGKLKPEETDFIPNSPYIVVSQGADSKFAGLTKTKRAVIDYMRGDVIFNSENDNWNQIYTCNVILPENKLIVSGIQKEGDKFEKISAWLGPVKDNIDQILGSKSMTAENMFEEMVREGMIEVEAMAFIQGRSIANAIIILDEAQNITPREARMVVERCGKNSKVILLGDPSQVENSYLDARSNGLAHAVSGGKTLKECGTVTLTKVERSVLASVASTIFNAPEARR